MYSDKEKKDYDAKYDTYLNNLNEEIKSLKVEVNQKMDSYFLEEEKSIYETMMKYSNKPVK